MSPSEIDVLWLLAVFAIQHHFFCSHDGRGLYSSFKHCCFLQTSYLSNKNFPGVNRNEICRAQMFIETLK